MALTRDDALELDRLDPLAPFRERFARASGASLVVEPREDHFGHLDPTNPLWKAVTAWL